MVVMDRMGLRERDLLVDLERGGTSSEEDGSNESTSCVRHANELLWSDFGSIDESIRMNTAVNWSDGYPNSVEVPIENGQLLADKKFVLGEVNVSLKENKIGTEKPKRKTFKKAPKPPRPPKSPSLDAADQKLVREISEFAMLKRARIERMKALKKVKNAKSASSNSNVWALIITILFCLVIIWQGLCSRSSSNVSFEGSPESSVGTSGGLISVQYFRNASPSNSNGSSSSSPNLVEQVSGLDDGKVEASRVVE